VAEYGVARLLGWRPGEGLVAALTVDAQFVTNIAFGPGRLVALTGPKENRGEGRGAVWVFESRVLTEAANP